MRWCPRHMALAALMLMLIDTRIMLAILRIWRLCMRSCGPVTATGSMHCMSATSNACSNIEYLNLVLQKRKSDTSNEEKNNLTVQQKGTKLKRPIADAPLSVTAAVGGHKRALLHKIFAQSMCAAAHSASQFAVSG